VVTTSLRSPARKLRILAEPLTVPATLGETVDEIVVTAPAPTAAELVAPVDGDLAATLDRFTSATGSRRCPPTTVRGPRWRRCSRPMLHVCANFVGRSGITGRIRSAKRIAREIAGHE